MLQDIDVTSVRTQMVTCPNGLDAFMALPTSPGPHPAVIQLHERYGLVDHTRDLAVRYATEGYAVIAPNLFFRETPERQAAIKAAEDHGSLNDECVMEDVSAAFERLLEESGVSPGAPFCIGFCASGRYPFLVSAAMDVCGTMVFYGRPGLRVPGMTDEEIWAEAGELIAKSRSPVLGIFGEGDSGISLVHVDKLRAALDAAKRSYRIHIYEDAPHGWLNDTMPGRYRRPQAEAAWIEMMHFMSAVRGGFYTEGRFKQSFTSDVSLDYDFTKNVRWA